jgi:carotenoid cleavage dioxygenase-like enzyme
MAASIGHHLHVVPLDYNDDRCSNSSSSSSNKNKKIGVIRRKEGIRVYKAPAFLATHWVNAFETESDIDGVKIHLDGAITANPSLMSHWALANVRADPPCIDYSSGDDSSNNGTTGTTSRAADLPNNFFRRLTLDLKNWPSGTKIADQIEKESREKEGEDNDEATTTIKPTCTNIPEDIFTPLATSDDPYGHAFELPSIHPSFISRKYRYAYGCCVVPRPSNGYNAVCKMDLHTGTVQTWSFSFSGGGGGGITGEPVFIPNPHGVSEDDRVAVGIFTQPDGRTAVVILDGESWEEIGRAVLPYSIPSGFHACWLFD